MHPWGHPSFVYVDYSIQIKYPVPAFFLSLQAGAHIALVPSDPYCLPISS